MKKGTKVLWLLFFTLIIPVILPTLSGIEVIEKTTGKVSAQSTNVSIQVSVPLANLTIISPKNGTYLTNKNILLNYSVSGQQAVWYNLDKGSNTTVTGATYFNTSEGSHTLYLYANNTDNNITAKNVTFYVNLTRFTILYSEYNGSTKGSSTDFIQYTYEELQNLSNIILENTENGKILFNEVINLTDDENFSDNILDLDTYTNISFNRTELNSSALPNFNKPTTLWLYNLTFSNPRILRDGSVCPSTICTQESYSGGTLKFNVTQFTIYSAEETPVEEEVVPTPAPPVGGGGPLVIKGFSVSPEEIKVKLKQRETTTKNIIITNNGNQRLSMSITNPKLQDFLKISETDFSLNAGESKIIVLDILVREDTIPDLYIGKLIIKADGIEKEILVVVEVVTKAPLFDVKVTIPTRFLYVMPGEELFAKIELFNLGAIESVDIDIDYFIKDSDGNNIVSEHETIAVETKISYLKEIKIPKDVAFGKYVIYVKATYDEKVASSTAWFEVIPKITLIYFILKNLVLIIIIGAILIIIILIIILRKFIKIKPKLKRPKKKKGENIRDYKRRIKERLRNIKKYKKQNIQ